MNIVKPLDRQPRKKQLEKQIPKVNVDYTMLYVVVDMYQFEYLINPIRCLQRTYASLGYDINKTN